MLDGLMYLAQGAPCGPAQQVIEVLRQQHDEEIVAQGLSEAYGHVIVMMMSPDGKTWTLVAIRPDGLACALDVGVMMELNPETKKEIY